MLHGINNKVPAVKGALKMWPATPRGQLGTALAASPLAHPHGPDLRPGNATERAYGLLSGIDEAFGIPLVRGSCLVRSEQSITGANPGFCHGTAPTRQVSLLGYGSLPSCGFGLLDGEHEPGSSLGSTSRSGSRNTLYAPSVDEPGSAVTYSGGAA